MPFLIFLSFSATSAPEEKDYLAAHSFLSMVLAPSTLSQTIAALSTAPLGHWAAKDLLRAAELPPLKPKQSAPRFGLARGRMRAKAMMKADWGRYEPVSSGAPPKPSSLPSGSR